MRGRHTRPRKAGCLGQVCRTLFQSGRSSQVGPTALRPMRRRFPSEKRRRRVRWSVRVRSLGRKLPEQRRGAASSPSGGSPSRKKPLVARVSGRRPQWCRRGRVPHMRAKGTLPVLHPCLRTGLWLIRHVCGSERDTRRTRSHTRCSRQPERFRFRGYAGPWSRGLDSERRTRCSCCLDCSQLRRGLLRP